MAVVGLFTLGTSKIGFGILGGHGTGFVDGVSLSTGAVVGGVQGFTGSATGASTSSGSVSGIVSFVGSVNGVTVSTGTATGFKNKTGSVAGITTSDGSSVGFPSLSGESSGAILSTGSAQGSKDVPPSPPAPDPSGGGGSASSPYKLVHWQPAKKKTTIPRPTHFSGKSHGYTSGKTIVVGLVNNFGEISGSTFNSGFASGVRYPTDEVVAQWNRQKLENELLTIGLL